PAAAETSRPQPPADDAAPHAGSSTGPASPVTPPSTEQSPRPDPGPPDSGAAPDADDPRPAPRPDEVVVNVADWAPPEQIPAGWLIVNAPRPLNGEITWDGEFRHGTFYA